MFGNAVSLLGDTALIGASPFVIGGAERGSAYVFTRSGTAWSQKVKLTPADAAGGDFFAGSVALAADTALISSAQDDDKGTDSGSVYFFGP